MGVEGLNLIPQLIISKTDESLFQGLILTDKNLTTCVEVSVSSKSGKFYFE